MPKRPPLILAVTGASGAPYARRLLRHLVRRRIRVELVFSEAGARLVREELDASPTAEGLCGGRASGVSMRPLRNVGARIAWGGAPTLGMAVVPCSMGRVGSFAAGLASDLIDRAAAVTLKEGRRLVLVTREAPVGLLHLEGMVRLARAGAVILPASPGFYTRPRTIDNLLDFMVVKICASLGLPAPEAPGYRV